ncbi:hypothetical protein D3C74_385740 [compost metagenome]
MVNFTKKELFFYNGKIQGNFSGILGVKGGEVIMEKLEVLVNADFDMEVQENCGGSCHTDCDEGSHCSAHNSPWW